MKKGYVINEHPNLIPSNFDVVYAVGMSGVVRDITFMSKWASLQPAKRGIIHRPAVSVEKDEYDNASAFLELLQELGNSSWQNGNPIIIDIWGASGEQRYNLDHVRVYGQYIRDHFKPLTKPLLRINIATWNAYLKSNRVEAVRLLQNYDLLLVQPGSVAPDFLEEAGSPKWWEYQLGMYAFDETGTWVDSPNKPVVNPVPEPAPNPTPIPEPSPEPTPTPTPSPEPLQMNIPKKWKISFSFGFIKFSGEIEALEE